MSTFGSSSNVLAFGLLLFLSTSLLRVTSESVRETETWMPLKAAVTHQHDSRESSGDFGFTDNEEDKDEEEEDDDYYYDDWENEDEDEDYEDEVSGSGDDDAENERSSPERDWLPSTERPDADNRIPEWAGPSRPTIRRDPEPENDNEIPLLRNAPRPGDQLPSNVLMSHAANGDGVFSRTEVLAGLICGGVVVLTVAVLLVVLLLHRMKKKDEGSYELAKKPIYTKAPTAEIYA
ncbi:syndecan-4 isoform X2 [Hippocampus zosterae]|uniref:syndecan-4 isoform X2 n=1 Tax=Hippocampus zosterae TaxID=109293 RepID=UPI00223DF9D6|nr:syndecan-4 isoform X2 [Hippocampus zosterae]